MEWMHPLKDGYPKNFQKVLIYYDDRIEIATFIHQNWIKLDANTKKEFYNETFKYWLLNDQTQIFQNVYWAFLPNKPEETK